ncbi:hypothetical protein [Micromonospora sp. NPDC002575]|uniref:hypothetical protein n=1 Tax=Micromonospora sp. NPDC002575 TaxID=3364222 RepID=UPI0036BCC254
MQLSRTPGSSPAVAGLVLAAGAGRRYGRPKAPGFPADAPPADADGRPGRG